MRLLLLALGLMAGCRNGGSQAVASSPMPIDASVADASTIDATSVDGCLGSPEGIATTGASTEVLLDTSIPVLQPQGLPFSPQVYAAFRDGSSYAVFEVLVDHPDNMAAYFASSAACVDNVLHVPYADGETPLPVLFGDHDDGGTISQNLCSSLHSQYAACRCPGNLTASCYANPPTVLADESP